MNLSRLAPILFAITCVATTARAQLGVYGTVTVEHTSNIKCLYATCGSSDGTIDPIGGVGGVYYDFKNYGRVRLGVDARAGSTITSKNGAQFLTGPKPRIFSALGGVRASFSTRYEALRPYVEGAVGIGRSNIQTSITPSLSDPSIPTTIQYPTGLEYRGFAGVDFRLLPYLDFRVVELGIGALRSQGSSYRMESISTGVVFHFGH